MGPTQKSTSTWIGEGSGVGVEDAGCVNLGIYEWASPTPMAEGGRHPTPAALWLAGQCRPVRRKTESQLTGGSRSSSSPSPSPCKKLNRFIK